MRYRYRAFSLEIASNFKLPELCPGLSDEVDVNICDNESESLAPICFDIEGVGRFSISNGNEIRVRRADQAKEDEVRVFLLGSALGAILHQRGFLVLHGNAIDMGGAAAAFLGPSGYGKSTLAGAFYQRGYRVLTDDVCAVFFENGMPMVVPGYPQIKLWRDAAEKMGLNAQELRRLAMRTHKFGFSLKEFPREPLPLVSIYILDKSTNNEFDVHNLNGIKKFQALASNTYRSYFISQIAQETLHFSQCHQLAQRVPIKRVLRPQSKFLLDELSELLLEDMKVARGEKDSGFRENGANYSMA